MTGTVGGSEEREPNGEYHRRELRLEGVRMEKARWANALAQAGLMSSKPRSVEEVAQILRYKILVAREYVWSEMKNLLIFHIQHGSQCCAEILLAMQEREEQIKKGPPKVDEGPGDVDDFGPIDFEPPGQSDF